jgi:RNA polymerase sigma factor (sigma-70 family)
MLGTAVGSLLQHVRRLAATAASDEQLLADYLDRRSDEAFAALVGRHGPMVLNVCRRVLHDAHAAEDVFQATFLVLAGRAGAIHRRASLAGFLHGVAFRLAVRARRRPVRDLPASLSHRAAGPAEQLGWKEMLGILDDELGRLSDRYRAPLVLCYLEGRTQDEAARQLGWGLNTLRRRLAQGRRLLEARLRGRGVTLPAALAGLLAASAATVPAPLRAATLAAAGARAVAGSTAGAALSPARKGITSLLSTSGRKIGAVVAVLGLAAAVGFGYCLTPRSDQPPPAGRPTPADAAREATADPLPARASVRLGTDRYRHGTTIDGLAVSADSGLAVTRSPWGTLGPVRVFDLTDGRCLYTLPRQPETDTEAVGLSPDGKTLATKDDRYLCFREAATGKEIRKVSFVPAAGGSRANTHWLTFSPDGKQVAVTLMGTAVRLIDVATGEEKRTFEHPAAVGACAFSPDGKLMATGGHEQEKDVYFARLWEVATGKELRRFTASDGWINALAFSPDGTTLAAGGFSGSRLVLWDVATGKELQTVPLLGVDAGSVAFAPDGKTVAVADDCVYLYDPATGKERLRIQRRARGLAFSPDGKVLTGAAGGAICRWDAASGKQLTPPEGPDTAVEQILVTADGRRLFTVDQDGDLDAWDTAGGKPPRRVADRVDRRVVASPDGGLLAWVVPGFRTGTRVRLYDVAADKFIDRFPVFADDASVEGFLPDGKAVLTLDRAASSVRVWDVESGKERSSFPAYSPKETYRRSISLPHASRRAALSPDGKTLVIGDMDRGLPVGLWDLATGKHGPDLDVRLTSVHAAADAAHPVEIGSLVNRRSLPGYVSSGNGLTFSPDGRLLVTWSGDPFGSSKTDRVAVWDAATGRAVTALMIDAPVGAVCAAFAPDGRTFATASADGVIRVWEVATWKVRAEFRGHRDRVTALAFGPDGRLFSGGLDTVVLGWDARPHRDADKGTLAEAWDALADADAKAGFQAQGRFLAEPGKAVEWLAARVVPVRLPDPARVKALVADLDSDDFATRDRATAGLKEAGPVAAAALSEVVANPPSAEARRRAEGLLKEMENGVLSPGELRALRAVELLEWVATPGARARLLELAKGAADARLSREAAAAGKRLEGRE